MYPKHPFSSSSLHMVQRAQKQKLLICSSSCSVSLISWGCLKCICQEKQGKKKKCVSGLGFLGLFLEMWPLGNNGNGNLISLCCWNSEFFQVYLESEDLVLVLFLTIISPLFCQWCIVKTHDVILRTIIPSSLPSFSLWKCTSWNRGPCGL